MIVTELVALKHSVEFPSTPVVLSKAGVLISHVVEGNVAFGKLFLEGYYSVDKSSATVFGVEFLKCLTLHIYVVFLP